MGHRGLRLGGISCKVDAIAEAAASGAVFNSKWVVGLLVGLWIFDTGNFQLDIMPLHETCDSAPGTKQIKALARPKTSENEPGTTPRTTWDVFSFLIPGVVGSGTTATAPWIPQFDPTANRFGFWAGTQKSPAKEWQFLVKTLSLNEAL